MAKKIIVLERLETDLVFRCAFWLTVPVARKPYYANPNLTSQYKDATAPEIDLLKDGSILEHVEEFNYSSGTSVASIQTDLISKFNDIQNRVTNFNQFQQYGRFWDGTSWTAGGVS